MSRQLRRTRTVLTATLTATFTATLAGSLLPLLPVAAHAADSPKTEIRLVLEDRNGDGTYSVYRREANGMEFAVVEELATRSLHDLDVTPDGSRFVAVEDQLDANGALLRERLVVRDVSGFPVRTVADVAASDQTQAVDEPTISPDGLNVVYARVAFPANGAPQFTLRQADVATGADDLIGTNLAAPVYVGPDLLLARSADPSMPGDFYGWRSYTISTRSSYLIAGQTAQAIPTDADQVRRSPDGTKLVWSLDTTGSAADAPYTADIQVAPVGGDGRRGLGVGSAVTVATGQANESPSWSRDGSTLFFTRYDGASGAGDVWSVPADGSSPAAATPGLDSLEVQTGAIDTVGSDPIPSVQPITLNGTAATLRWILPTDSDLSGTIISRYPLYNGTMKQIYVPAPLTSFVDSGLVLGDTYRYVFQSEDRSGYGGDGPTQWLTAAQALPAVQDPTSRTTTRAPFPVRFATAAAASVKYTVDYSINGGGYRRWVSNVAGVQRTFGSAATTGVAATVSTPGTTYRFRVSAADAYGNTTAQVLSGKSVVPFDQTRATLSGGTNVARGDSWFGTLRTLSAPAHYARIAVTGDRFQVLGERCPSCGVVDIYDGATRIASVDTRASARQPRAVLYTRLWSTVGNHTITLKPRGTAGRPSVVLDGFAVRR